MSHGLALHSLEQLIEIEVEFDTDRILIEINLGFPHAPTGMVPDAVFLIVFEILMSIIPGNIDDILADASVDIFHGPSMTRGNDMPRMRVDGNNAIAYLKILFLVGALSNG